MNKKYDLSVLITARNEMFLKKTVENVLENIRGNTEIIVVMDGGWAEPPLVDNERVTVLFHNKSVGQRAGVNDAAKLSRAKYIMKLDAHCAVDEGFDVKLMKNCEYDWTVIPRMYNLHAFDWVCDKCGHRIYQGPTPEGCEKCNSKMNRDILWKPRLNRKTDFTRFDSDLHFQYWGGYEKRPEAKGDIADTMSNLGACFFMHRDRYWELGGLDEKHGSWGQMGTEISCKTWLSGGRQVVNKTTWFSHMFRTQGGDFGFPYPQSGKQVDHARQYSRDLWNNNKWPKAKYKLEWLINKFSPVPGWPDKSATKGIIYYTDNRLNMKIAKKARSLLSKTGLDIVSASLKPMDFGKNVYLPLKRGYLTMFKQILAALKESTAEIVFMCEHDVFYHPSHFAFVPPKDDIFYYNTNVWKVRLSDGLGVKTDDCKQVSGICAYRKLLVKHYEKRVQMIEDYISKNGEKDLNKYMRAMGFEPGTHRRPERVDDFKSENWQSAFPNVDIRHDNNLTPSRFKKDQFRNQKFTKGWIESQDIPGWGRVTL